MRNLLFSLLLIMLTSDHLFASQSVIIDSQGYACMGDDRSRKETEQAAMQDARRNAGETALTYIRTETNIQDGVLEKDLVSAYTNAQVRMLQELMKGWFQDPASGDCYRVKVKMEVTPDDQAMTGLAKQHGKDMLDDPAAPLTVRVWTARDHYRAGERIKAFIKGNRPFYGKVIYKDATGRLIQLLPNPYRQKNYFNGGTVYELPAGEDHYDLEVCPPFGAETVTLYASTAPLGELDVTSAGGVYAVRTRAIDVPLNTRGVRIVAKERESDPPVAAEFAESGLRLTTSTQ